MNGFQFVQEEELVPGTDGRVIVRITCFRCQRSGHFSDMCPSDTIEEGDTNNIISEEVVANATTIEATDGQSKCDETNDAGGAEPNKSDWVNLRSDIGKGTG